MEKFIKIDVAGIVVTYDWEEVDSMEKAVPAIIVPNEEKKQELIEELKKQGGYTIYDIKADSNSPGTAQVTTIDTDAAPVDQEEIDAPGKPLPMEWLVP